MTSFTELFERRERRTARAFCFGVPRLQAFRESIQHSQNVVDRLRDRDCFVGPRKPEILGDIDLKCELIRFSSSEIERVQKLAVALPAAAFCDIAAYGYG